MNDTKQKALEAIKTAIIRVANVEIESISMDDNLIKDLFLDELDVPKVIVFSSQELGINLDQDVVDDFLSEIEEDPEKAVVTEIVAMLTEEMEF